MAYRYFRLLFAFTFAISARADLLTPTCSGDQWAQFDSSLGMLTDVWLTVSSRVGSTFTFADNQAHQVGQNDTVSGQLTAVLNARIADSLNNEVYSLSASRFFHGTSWAPGTLDLSGVASISKDWTTGLDVFEGEGDWRLGVSAGSNDLFLWWPTGVSIASAQQIFTSPYIAVTYGYDPFQTGALAPTHNPEPSEWLGMAGAVLIAGLVNRKRLTGLVADRHT